MAADHTRQLHRSQFRFYGPLNDFLPRPRRQRDVGYGFSGSPALRDAIQAQGVPHTEVDLLLVDGVTRGFDFHLQGRERISVYPRFKAFGPTPAGRLGPTPPNPAALFSMCTWKNFAVICGCWALTASMEMISKMLISSTGRTMSNGSF